jgi:hypothetical protein
MLLRQASVPPRRRGLSPQPATTRRAVSLCQHRMEIAMQTKPWTTLPLVTGMLLCGVTGVAVAGALPAPPVLLAASGGPASAGVGGNAAATLGRDENYGAGVGGNGSAVLPRGEDYNAGVGGNGSAVVRQGENYGAGVGGNGAAKLAPGQTRTGSGSDARGMAQWQRQTQH